MYISRIFPHIYIYIDFIYFKFAFNSHTDHGHSDDMYELNDRTKMKFYRAYTDLSYRMLVWPSIEEMRREGEKFEWIRQLDWIAREMGTPRPATKMLTKRTVPCQGKWVIKREFSANCDHVELVDLGDTPLDDPISLDVFQKVWEDTRYAWIVQEYVPLLQQWGEWRVFLMNGKTTCIVMTTKDKQDDRWHWNQTQSMFTLEKLTSVESRHTSMHQTNQESIYYRAKWKTNPKTSTDEVGYPKSLTKAEIKEAGDEINTFAETTLRHLIKAEQLAHHHTPSISLFCRLDIGIMPDDNGALKYFVNEVTRGPTSTCLFSGKDIDVEDIAPNLGTEFAVAFYEFLCAEHPKASVQHAGL
jgi:hypothetical protein